jgi:hypothetical protein
MIFSVFFFSITYFNFPSVPPPWLASLPSVTTSWLAGLPWAPPPSLVRRTSVLLPWLDGLPSVHLPWLAGLLSVPRRWLASLLASPQASGDRRPSRRRRGREHDCDICGKSLRDKFNLRRHLASHDGNLHLADPGLQGSEAFGLVEFFFRIRIWIEVKDNFTEPNILPVYFSVTEKQ